VPVVHILRDCSLCGETKQGLTACTFVGASQDDGFELQCFAVVHIQIFDHTTFVLAQAEFGSLCELSLAQGNLLPFRY